ncbi:MAG: hypothetical protein KGL35_13185, partial [Bradyrhizobium sp.]|nr:hypothetical protein [Bradyrhizobium sp.]
MSDDVKPETTAPKKLSDERLRHIKDSVADERKGKPTCPWWWLVATEDLLGHIDALTAELLDAKDSRDREWGDAVDKACRPRGSHWVVAAPGGVETSVAAVVEKLTAELAELATEKQNHQATAELLALVSREGQDTKQDLAAAGAELERLRAACREVRFHLDRDCPSRADDILEEVVAAS